MGLDRATVAKVANLARIKVAEEDLDAMAGELSRILAFVEQLDRVDTAGVEPMASVVGQKLRLRADRVSDGGDADRVLANAPAGVGGFFAVPKVVE